MFDPSTDSLFIAPKESASNLISVMGSTGAEPFNLLVRVEPTKSHVFRFTPKTDNGPISIMGNFNDWSRTSDLLSDEDRDGIFETTLYLKPNLYEYKFVIGDSDILDPANEDIVSNNMGGWNSVLDLTSFKKKSSGQWIKNTQKGSYLSFNFLSLDKSLPVETIVLWKNIPLHPDVVDPKINGDVSVNINNLNDGLLRIMGLDDQGRVIRENHTIIKNGIPLNTNENQDDWHFRIIYSLMVDRFLDGNHSNTRKSEGEIHPLTDFNGGDFAGVIQKLGEGYFSDLGISAIWISPVQEQPNHPNMEWSSPNRTYTGYHGYWPVSPREIDPRYGTEEELKKLIDTAHNQDIKVLLDLVSNHVHEDHPYYTKYREWFGNVILPDGSMNIRRWDGETRLTTWVEPFLPSFNYSNSEAIDAVVEDALWWMKEFKLDGFRQDAVKHVPHSFWKNLTFELEKNFPDKNVYQIGETFGSDELILSYVNPAELNAQFNFDIYFIARNIFKSPIGDMSSLKETMEQNLQVYQPINLMGTITSSHDQIRFISVADEQMTYVENGTERAFSDPPEEVEHMSSYQKLANFTAFNFSIPGIPVVYYGEEIGLEGAGDPDNRRTMRFGKNLNMGESMLNEKVSSLAYLRREYSALSIGDFYSVYSDGPVWAYLKVYFDEIILVAINQSDKNQSVSFDCPIPVTSWRRLKNDIPFSLSGIKTTVHLQPYSYGYFLGE
ncbi:MAG: alpha-amylase family glycosyl hydrolase [Candidatus Marinimicrobia bacterium]|nr:alpha-amylase family glycosyl hydrolase [Candidatus Neomarinimicrobiota bacterium]